MKGCLEPLNHLFDGKKVILKKKSTLAVEFISLSFKEEWSKLISSLHAPRPFFSSKVFQSFL